MKKGLLIILSGPSGVGKGTVRKRVFEDKDLNLVYSVSMTTRLPRRKEKPNVDYYFVDKEYFEENIKKGNFLEYCQFVGNYYGTPLDKVEEWRNQGKNVFLEIEINGASQVLQKCHGDDVISIFLMPPSIEALEQRIRRRKTETEEVIQERLKKARSEMPKHVDYGYVVINDEIEHAAAEIANIIKSKIN